MDNDKDIPTSEPEPPDKFFQHLESWSKSTKWDVEPENRFSSPQSPVNDYYAYSKSTQTTHYKTHDFAHEKELEWWRSFSEKYPYPLYCILLAEADDEVARQFMEKERSFIDHVTGKVCCLIYFRDLDRAKFFDNPFELAEHTRWNNFISSYTRIEFDKYPCFLFFEDFTHSDWIIFSLKDMSLPQVKTLFQQVCTYIHQPQKQLFTNKEKSAFEKLSQYGKGHVLKKRGKVFGRWIEEYAPGIIAEFLKTMIGLQ
ncbi:hypothetical protein KDA_71260 [Dictyobacter alpinus]|uniref:Uncharacterized protein n=1 Tax=Dictyobacter alpinus TaxID=2014873 RepID=A0A402BJW1_9CHLR|nr:hypothetical protein [Dictyobacter alpinus]GCE31642.1 hypothetical protein KDA_71260 [Dictyobacter alpinus]